MAQGFALGNILREVPIDLSSGDFTDESGFFLRSSSGGVVRYCPMNNLDSEAITKTIDASAEFKDPVLMRKLFQLITSPSTDLYAGYGV